MRNLYNDILLQSRINAGSYAGVIESDLPSHEVFARLGANAGPNADSGGAIDGFNAWSENHMEIVAAMTGGRDNHTARINGTKIPHLPLGSKLKIMPLGDGAIGSEMDKALERHIAAAVGQSAEEFSRNFGEASYSALKYGLFFTQRSAANRRKKVAETVANTLFRCWLEEAIMTGKINAMPRVARRLGWIYEGQNLDALANAKWIGGSRGMLDELKETQAAKLRVDMGISTREDEASALGKDWEEIDAQQAREKRNREKLGLVEEVKTKSQAALGKSPKSTG